MKIIFFIPVIILSLIFGETRMATAQTDTFLPKQAAIVPIAAFTANGNTEQLKKALIAGLEAGLTVNETKEILIQMYAYAGFPRSLTALSTFMNLLAERNKEGIRDEIGDFPNEIPVNANKLAIGEKIQTGLVGRPVNGPLYEFCPDIGIFLKEHLFCDIFARNILTEQERELATIAALAALPAPAQLASHFRVCRNIGMTDGQLKYFTQILEKEVGQPEAKLSAEVFNKILKSAN